MDDIKRIIFELVDENKVDIHAVVREKINGIPAETIKIGHIFSKGSYSGKDSIQVCGFDNIKGPWSCGIFNHSMDVCLQWNDLKNFLKKKTGVKEYD